MLVSGTQWSKHWILWVHFLYWAKSHAEVGIGSCCSRLSSPITMQTARELVQLKTDSNHAFKTNSACMWTLQHTDNYVAAADDSEQFTAADLSSGCTCCCISDKHLILMYMAQLMHLHAMHQHYRHQSGSCVVECTCRRWRRHNRSCTSAMHTRRKARINYAGDCTYKGVNILYT